MDDWVVVSIGTFMPMCIPNAIKNWFKYRTYPFFYNQSVHIAQVLFYTYTFGILHYQIDIPFAILMEIYKMNNVGMVERCQSMCFLLQLGSCKFIQHIVIDDFNRDLLFLDELVYSQIDSTHTALANYTYNPVVENFFTYHDSMIL